MGNGRVTPGLSGQTARPDPQVHTVDNFVPMLFDTCFPGEHTTMQAPYPCYRHLHDRYTLASRRNASGRDHLSGQYFADLITRCHLSGLSEHVSGSLSPTTLCSTSRTCGR